VSSDQSPAVPDDWTKINFSFPNLTSIQDTTTWSAQIQGDPVRLIE
jgi:hypothetical protein